jgi:hypothetical protein
VRGRARGADRDIDRFGLRFRSIHEILDSAIRRILAHRKRIEIDADQSQRVELVEPHVHAGAGRDRQDDRHGSRQHDVRVAALAGDVTLRDGAAAARAILDDQDLGQELVACDGLGDRARNEVGAAARCGVHHELYRFGRIRLCGYVKGRGRKQYERRQGELHISPPPVIRRTLQ